MRWLAISLVSAGMGSAGVPPALMARPAHESSPNAVEPLVFRGAMSGSCTGGKQSFGDKCVPKPEFGNEETGVWERGNEGKNSSLTFSKTVSLLATSATNRKLPSREPRMDKTNFADRWRARSRTAAGCASNAAIRKEAGKCLCHLWSLWSRVSRRGAGGLLVGRIRHAKEMRRFMPDRLGDARRKPEQ